MTLHEEQAAMKARISRRAERTEKRQSAMKSRIARRTERRARHDAKVAQLRAEFLASTQGLKPLSTEELLRAARRHFEG